MKIPHIITTKSGPLQSPLPSLDRSSRCSNLSRALGPEHTNKSAGFCSGVLFRSLSGLAIVFFRGAGPFSAPRSILVFRVLESQVHRFRRLHFEMLASKSIILIYIIK
jgi:hypothetical protein